MENTNQTTFSEQPQSNINLEDLEKKPVRKYNGFLRNNSKKTNRKPTPDMHLKTNEPELSEQPQSNINLENNPSKQHNLILNSNKKIHKKPTPNMHLKTNKKYKEKTNTTEVNLIPQIIEVKQTTEEYEVFNFLRTKTGHNEKKFWDNITTILSQKSFSEIKKSNLSLIAYAVLHDSNIVFDKLLVQFGEQVTKEEFINCIFKYSIHKNPDILKSSLKFYEKNFIIDNVFLQELIKDFSALSYRFETNVFLLSWLAPKLTPELLNLFWTESISHKNVPIILQSLQYKEYSKYLNKNLHDYEDSLKLLGRLYQIKQLLGDLKILKKVDDIKESVIIKEEEILPIEQDLGSRIWLSDKKEQFKVIQESLTSKKPIEVVVKRKRKIA